jgi:hypothetical protein
LFASGYHQTARRPRAPQPSVNSIPEAAGFLTGMSANL